ALDELGQILWREGQPIGSTSSDSSDSEGDADDGSPGQRQWRLGSSVADSICSIDTLPRLSMGRVRPASTVSSVSSSGTSSSGIQLGRMRLRLRGRRRGRRRRQQQQRQSAMSPDRRVYRLPLGLRP
ncbi:hypothetical protein H4R23_006997, partial [Coemansia sp. Cherry 401B]